MFLEFSKLLKITIISLFSYPPASHQLPPRISYFLSWYHSLYCFFFFVISVISRQFPFFFSPFSTHPYNPHFFFQSFSPLFNSSPFLPSILPLYLTSKFISLRPNIFNFIYHNKNIKLKINYNGCNYQYLKMEMKN